MKKATAVILSILLVFSIFSCAVFAEDSLPSPDDIVYEEPTIPVEPKKDFGDYFNMIFGSFAAGEDGPFAQFISTMRNFFEQALNLMQPVIKAFAGNYDTADTSALQTIVRNLVAAFK